MAQKPLGTPRLAAPGVVAVGLGQQPGRFAGPGSAAGKVPPAQTGPSGAPGPRAGPVQPEAVPGSNPGTKAFSGYGPPRKRACPGPVLPGLVPRGAKAVEGGHLPAGTTAPGGQRLSSAAQGTVRAGLGLSLIGPGTEGPGGVCPAGQGVSPKSPGAGSPVPSGRSPLPGKEVRRSRPALSAGATSPGTIGRRSGVRPSGRRGAGRAGASQMGVGSL